MKLSSRHIAFAKSFVMHARTVHTVIFYVATFKTTRNNSLYHCIICECQPQSDHLVASLHFASRITKGANFIDLDHGFNIDRLVCQDSMAKEVWHGQPDGNDNRY